MGLGATLWISQERGARIIGILTVFIALLFLGYGTRLAILEQKLEAQRENRIKTIISFLEEGKTDLSEWKNGFDLYDDIGKNKEETKYQDWYTRTENYLSENDPPAATIFRYYSAEGESCDNIFLKERISKLETILAAANGG